MEFITKSGKSQLLSVIMARTINFDIGSRDDNIYNRQDTYVPWQS